MEFLAAPPNHSDVPTPSVCCAGVPLISSEMSGMGQLQSITL
jgi:hypothetical protein